ncbi:MAG: phosphoribosylamine--glycine ligase [Ignavibacteria bacterium]|jgi:phosphoribosylamine--glycine ligase|nr:phosphoribosylamine--glycine ligase [Ignavibacteria bacterium]
MKILLIGSGGREHCLAEKLSKSKSTEKLYCLPGNPGMLGIAEPLGLRINDYKRITEFCLTNQIDLVVVGPEAPLADGIVDILSESNIKCFAPTKAAAQLECSKTFAKYFMRKHKIPTAKFRKICSENIDEAMEYIESHSFPIVIKADGLAAGKGVIVANNAYEAKAAVIDMFKGKFKEAGKIIVVEEFLEGEEASILAICDGNDFLLLPHSQDHKRIYDNDEGPNTGGMGAYSPTKIINDEILKKVEEQVLKPTLNYMREEGTPFVGCLYVGLMIHNGGVNVVEYNARFGDPETQAVLAHIEGDFAKLLYSAASGNIDKSAIRIKKDLHSCCVVLASKGYPISFEKGFEIKGLENIGNEDVFLYQSGTTLENGKLLTDGGRVLSLVTVADSLEAARKRNYEEIEKISYLNKYYRKDIALKGI